MDLLLFILMVFCFSYGGSVLCYRIAKRKGRSARSWAILGCLFGVIALLLILLLPSVETSKRSQDAQDSDEPKADTTEALKVPDQDLQSERPRIEQVDEATTTTRVPTVQAEEPGTERVDEGKEIRDILLELQNISDIFLKLRKRIENKQLEIADTRQNLRRVSAESERWTNIMQLALYSGREEVISDAESSFRKHNKDHETLIGNLAQQLVELDKIKKEAIPLQERFLTAKNRLRELDHAVDNDEMADMSVFDKQNEEEGDYSPDTDTPKTNALIRAIELERARRKSAVGLEAMTPDDFEALVARLYERMGFDVDLTQHSRDGGVDLYARRENEAGVEEIAVQCKHYSGTVGVAEARALYGVVSAERRLTRGVLVTSGSFSTGCQEFADRNRIGLIDGEHLRELLEENEVQ